MGEIENRLAKAGLALPVAPQAPQGVTFPFSMVQRHGPRLLISGHGPQKASGGYLQGKVDADMTVEQGYEAARLVALSILASIKRELGELDRVTRWVKVFGMVNCSPGFCQQPSVINGFSDLILRLYGEGRGAHTRSAVGMVALPFNIPVEVEAEVEVDAS